MTRSFSVDLISVKALITKNRFPRLFFVAHMRFIILILLPFKKWVVVLYWAAIIGHGHDIILFVPDAGCRSQTLCQSLVTIRLNRETLFVHETESYCHSMQSI